MMTGFLFVTTNGIHGIYWERCIAAWLIRVHLAWESIGSGGAIFICYTYYTCSAERER